MDYIILSRNCKLLQHDVEECILFRGNSATDGSRAMSL